MGQNGRPVSKATAALAASIREAEGAADVSTAELSRRASIPYSTMRKIRSGGQSIDYEQLRRIAIALGVPAAKLAARAEEIEAGL